MCAVHAFVHVSAHLRALILRPHSSSYLASHMLVRLLFSAFILLSFASPSQSDVDDEDCLCFI